MSVNITSNDKFQGDLSSLPSETAPLPFRASLYADFRKQVYINTVDGAVTKGIGKPLTAISFARDTGGVQVLSDGSISYAVINSPRFDFDVSGAGIIGLLSERETTNYIRNSDSLADNSYYEAVGSALSSADNGFFSLATDNLNSAHYLSDKSTNTSVSTAQNGAISVYAKPGTGRYLQISAPTLGSDVYANFDLKKGKVTKIGRINRAQIEPGLHGSWRCVLAFLTPSVKTVTEIRYAIVNSPTELPGTAYLGDGRTILLSSPQMELGQSFATSIVSPPSGNKNRKPDNIFLKHNQASLTDFTLLLSGRMTRNEQGAASGNGLVFIYNSENRKGVSVGLAAGTSASPYALFLRVDGDVTTTEYPGHLGFRSFGQCQIVIRVSGGKVTILTDGNDPETFSMTGVSGLTSIQLGAEWGGWLEKVVFYPFALNDVEMKKAFYREF